MLKFNSFRQRNTEISAFVDFLSQINYSIHCSFVTSFSLSTNTQILILIHHRSEYNNDKKENASHLKTRGINHIIPQKSCRFDQSSFETTVSEALFMLLKPFSLSTTTQILNFFIYQSFSRLALLRVFYGGIHYRPNYRHIRLTYNYNHPCLYPHISRNHS